MNSSSPISNFFSKDITKQEYDKQISKLDSRINKINIDNFKDFYPVLDDLTDAEASLTNMVDVIKGIDDGSLLEYCQPKIEKLSLIIQEKIKSLHIFLNISVVEESYKAESAIKPSDKDELRTQIQRIDDIIPTLIEIASQKYKNPEISSRTLQLITEFSSLRDHDQKQIWRLDKISKESLLVEQLGDRANKEDIVEAFTSRKPDKRFTSAQASACIQLGTKSDVVYDIVVDPIQILSKETKDLQEIVDKLLEDFESVTFSIVLDEKKKISAMAANSAEPDSPIEIFDDKIPLKNQCVVTFKNLDGTEATAHKVEVSCI